jgi:hypothetical protein
MNMDSADINVFTCTGKVWLAIGRFVVKLVTSWNIYIDILCTEFYANRIRIVGSVSKTSATRYRKILVLTIAM